MPCDLTAFYKVSDLIIRPETEVLDGHHLVHLWVAAYLKWPVAIDQWMAHEAPGVSAGARLQGLSGRTLQAYVDQSVSVARRIDRLPLKWMHASISTKRVESVPTAQR